MRRVCLVGAAVAACSLAFGVAGSTAATKGKSKKTINVTCKLQLAVMVPVGESSVTAPAAQGNEYGSAACGKLLGAGVYSDGFTLQDSGDLTGKYAQYSGGGSLYGTYDLTQASTQPPPTPYVFGNADLTGTFKIKGGTGAFAKAKGKGTLICSTVDSIHYTCVEKLKFSAL